MLSEQQLENAATSLMERLVLQTEEVYERRRSAGEKRRQTKEATDFGEEGEESEDGKGEEDDFQTNQETERQPI